MKKTWKFRDTLDFIYFFSLDGQEAEEEKLHERDRQFFLRDEKDRGDIKPSPQYCLRLWLHSRRKDALKSGNSFLPGDAIQETHALFRLGLFIAGLLFGCALGVSYFAYTGKTPLNVFQFLTIFILPQLLIILIMAGRSIVTLRRPRPSSPLKRTLYFLYSRFFSFLKKKVLQPLAAPNRSALQDLLAKELGALSFWPLFCASQLFGLGFNLAIIAVTLVKITTTDLAFGWQSTLQFGPESLFAAVRFLAAPWSWLLSPEFSYPSLIEIEGSRIILKDGIYHLLTENLTSWWPFLLLCLLFYGLLPRIVLFFFGYLMERHAIRSHLSHSRYDSIVKRMTNPLVSSQAPPEQTTAKRRPTVSDKEKKYAASSSSSPKSAILLIPGDIFEKNSLAALEQLVLPFGYQPLKRYPIFQSYGADETLAEDMARMDWNTIKGVVIFLEAWMVPIREHIVLLSTLAGSIPTEKEIAVCFLGRPGTREGYDPPTAEQVQMWQEKMVDLHNRIIFLETPSPFKQHQISS